MKIVSILTLMISSLAIGCATYEPELDQTIGFSNCGSLDVVVFNDTEDQYLMRGIKDSVKVWEDNGSARVSRFLKAEQSDNWKPEHCKIKVRFGDVGQENVADTSYIGKGTVGCLMTIGSGYTEDRKVYSDFWTTVAHELGHCYRVTHNDDVNSLMYPETNPKSFRILQKDINEMCQTFGCKGYNEKIMPE